MTETRYSYTKLKSLRAICSRRTPRNRLALCLMAPLLCGFITALLPSVHALDKSTQTIRANEVWENLGITGRHVTVAVIDSGIYRNHQDFQGAIKAIWGFPSNTSYLGDDENHGTPIAGIIAGRGVEDPAYKGVAPEAQLVIVKITNGPDLDDAIRWVISNQETYNIKVLNLSTLSPDVENLKGKDGMSVYSKAVDQAIEAGIIVVASAGNDGPNPRTIRAPSDAFNVITVGAIDDKNTTDISDDTLWNESSRGPTGDDRPKLDVVAPGVNITAPTVPPGFYKSFSGASTAAPHVAGVVALMLEANPFLTPAQVKAILRQTARLNTNLLEYTVNDRGYGIVDAYAAVQLARTPLWINAALMYDSWNVKTPSRELFPTWKTWDNLTFTVDTASARFGIGLSNVRYHFRDNWGFTGVDYSLLNSLSATHVWIDNTYHNLGMNMSQYLFTGPRIWSKGPGYVKMWARYRVNNVFIECFWKMDVDEMYLKLDFGQIPSWRTLIYIDPNVYDSTNYAYLPSTSEKAMYETTVYGDLALDIRNSDPGQTDYIEIDPVSTDNPLMHVINYGYFGNNPYSVQNYEYIYNRDIVVYYQAGTAVVLPDPGPSIYRKTNPMIDPSPTQNDADTGGDAGNNFNTATIVNMPVSRRGILCYSDPVDTEDWYQFYVDQGATIVANMTPSYGIDFNLELYSPSGVLIAGSNLGPSLTDRISYVADSGGYWRIRIYQVSGEALYYFSIMNPHGQGGGHPPNMPDSVDPGTES